MKLDIEAILEESRGRNFEVYEQHINPVFAKVLRTIGFNRSWVKAENAYLWDDEGRRYLDFLSNWGVFNFGRQHPTIVDAVQQTLASDFPSWIGFDAPALAGVLARELKARMPNDLDLVYFSNSGTEAVEAAIKFARGSTGKPGIVHLEKAFHGLTNGALSLNGEPNFRRGFDPLLPGSVSIPKADIEALRVELEKGDKAAFILEPIQGKSLWIADDAYLLEAQALCRKHGALFVVDEVQSGMARTGKFLACAHVPGIDPDIVCLSKALSGGLVPIGATITRRSIYDRVFDDMNRAIVHACTFGMGNLAMAAGLGALKVIDDENLEERARDLGAHFRSGLEAMRPQFQFIKAIHQRGLMIGIEFGEPSSLKLKAGWKMVNKMDRNLFAQAVVIPLLDDHGILTQVAGHNTPIIKLLPPLTISEADVEYFLRSFEDVMEKLHRFPGPAWEVLKKLGKHALTAKNREGRATAS